MVIDTSAIIAVPLNEANAARVAQAIETRSPSSPLSSKSAGGLDRDREPKGEEGGRELNMPLHRAAIEVVAVDQDQAEIARLAWRRFGKGRHPAGLNYGDCFAYALTKARRLPLLYQGNNSLQTDITGVSLPPATI